MSDESQFPDQGEFIPQPPQHRPDSSESPSQPESASAIERLTENASPYAPPRAEMLLAAAAVPTQPPTPPRFARAARWSWILSCLSAVPVVILIVMAVRGDAFRPVLWPAVVAEVIVSIGSVLALVAYCGNSATGSNRARGEAIVGAAVSIVALMFVNLGAFGAIGVMAMRQDNQRGRPSSRPPVIRPLEESLERAAP